MTYCLGICVKDGLMFASDSRTNAGVDYVTSYSKMHVFTPAPDRLFVILSAGNLATTQEIVNIIQRDIDYPNGGDNLLTARYLFEAADYVGRVSQMVQQQHGVALQQSGVSGEVSLIIGGQIQGQSHGLMLIYPQGNHIEASKSTPYLQIGETKYGKPALNSTTMSNITVGPPYELAIYYVDQFQLASRCKFDESGEYLKELQNAWTNGLIQAFTNLPRFDWEERSSNQMGLQFVECESPQETPPIKKNLNQA
ncbi:MAG: 20S proteasome subunit A/B [Candidatus Thiodiazotropha sp.]